MSDKVLDTRDLMKRLEELKDQRSAYVESVLGTEFEDSESADKKSVESIQDEWAEENEADAEELTELEELESEVSEWADGNTLIRDDYFTDYCRELLEDCGTMPKDLPWFIENNINWDGVSEDMMVDYSTCEYQGDTYYYRNC